MPLLLPSSLIPAVPILETLPLDPYHLTLNGPQVLQYPLPPCVVYFPDPHCVCAIIEIHRGAGIGITTNIVLYWFTLYNPPCVSVIAGGAVPSASSIGPNSLLSRARRNAATATAENYKPDVNYSTYDNNFESKSSEDCGDYVGTAVRSSRAASSERVSTRGKQASRLPWDRSKVCFILSIYSSSSWRYWSIPITHDNVIRLYRGVYDMLSI